MKAYVFPEELSEFLRCATHLTWRSEDDCTYTYSKFAGQPMMIKLKVRDGGPPIQSYLEITMEDLVSEVLPFSYNSDDLLVYYVMRMDRDKQCSSEPYINLAVNRACSKMLEIIRERKGVENDHPSRS